MVPCHHRGYHAQLNDILSQTLDYNYYCNRFWHCEVNTKTNSLVWIVFPVANENNFKKYIENQNMFLLEHKQFSFSYTYIHTYNDEKYELNNFDFVKKPLTTILSILRKLHSLYFMYTHFLCLIILLIRS